MWWKSGAGLLLSPRKEKGGGCVRNKIRFHGESGAQVTFDVDDKGRDALKELVEYRGENLHVEVTKTKPRYAGV